MKRFQRFRGFPFSACLLVTLFGLLQSSLCFSTNCGKATRVVDARFKQLAVSNRNYEDSAPGGGVSTVISSNKDGARAGTDGYSVMRQPLSSKDWDPNVDPSFDAPTSLEEEDVRQDSDWWAKKSAIAAPDRMDLLPMSWGWNPNVDWPP